MQLYTSMIVFDEDDVRLVVVATAEERRLDLVEFHNDNSDDIIEADSPLSEVTAAIAQHLMMTVILGEIELP